MGQKVLISPRICYSDGVRAMTYLLIGHPQVGRERSRERAVLLVGCGAGGGWGSGTTEGCCHCCPCPPEARLSSCCLSVGSYRSPWGGPRGKMKEEINAALSASACIDCLCLIIKLLYSVLLPFLTLSLSPSLSICLSLKHTHTHHTSIYTYKQTNDKIFTHLTYHAL